MKICSTIFGGIFQHISGLPTPEVGATCADEKALKVEFCDYCHHLCSGGNAPWCGGKGFRCECPGRCELSHSAAPPAAMVRETGQDQPVVVQTNCFVRKDSSI